MDSWVRHFRSPSLEKIRECETFLADYGIMPISGVEQEYYNFQPRDTKGRYASSPLGLPEIIKSTANSSFVEKAYRENKHAVHEVVFGKGKGKYAKPFINPRSKPSVMVRAVESGRKIIENNLGEGKNTAFDATSRGERVRGLHVNLSLWDMASQIPLFPLLPQTKFERISLNPLTCSCLQSLLDAQYALIALNTTNPNAFKRFGEESTPAEIGWSVLKESGGSVVIRVTTDSDSNIYMENKISGSDTEPSIAMLVTLVGITEGVKKYLQQHHIHTPEEFRHHIASPDFSKGVIPQITRFPLPQNQQEALAITENSELAKQLLGENFHKQFCREYKQHMNQQIQPAR